MATYKNYIVVNSLEEAYTLNQKRNNFIVGGNAWLKQGNHPKDTLIDLSNLGLDKIEENEEEFKIGCMVTLRDLEINESLNQYTNNMFKECLKHIVGTQFRNCATIGGSVWGRFGFSDPLTLLLVLDTYVELYHDGLVSLQDFLNQPLNNDILVRIIIKKTSLKVAYESFRNQSTDFPVLTCAIAKLSTGYRVAIGARPQKAMLVTVNELDNVVDNFSFGSNMRASAEYRKELASVLVRRALAKMED